MSIIPSPGQMGPGTGLISIGTGLMKHPTLFKGLGMGPALSGLGMGIYLADLQSARRHGFGNDVQAYRDAQADWIWARYVTPAILTIMKSWNEQTLEVSTGGGGPGGLPNLHQSPLPSIEEAGEILANPSVMGEVSSSPRPSTSKKGRKKKRKACPPGYRWSRRAKRCLHRQDSYEDYRARQTSSW